MELDYKSIGERIRMIRTEAELTQEKLAERADISTTHMSNIENGLTHVSITTLVSIANVLSVSLDDLLCDSVVHATPQIHADIARLLSDCDEYEIRVIRDMIGEMKSSMRRVRRLIRENER